MDLGEGRQNTDIRLRLRFKNFLLTKPSTRRNVNTMNEFVNFQKRDVALPPGCKDIIDVLNYNKDLIYFSPPKKAKAPTEGLLDIEQYLSRMLQSPAQRRSLTIYSVQAASKVRLHLFWGKGLLRAMFFIPTDREAQIRSVLDDRGIPPTQDEPATDEDSRFIICALPTDAVSATSLVSELLQKGYGLPANIELEFHYREKSQD